MAQHPENSASSDPLPPLAIRLLKGVVYRKDHEELWQSLVNIQPRVQDHFAVLNLRLVLNEAEGYAYLRTRDEVEDEQGSHLPSLITRQPLSYPVTLLLALLRRRLVEHEAEGGDSRLVVTRDEVLELQRVFLPDSSDEVRVNKRLGENLNRIVRLGFLRRMAGSASSAEPVFEVQRIIKEFVTAEWLAALESRLGVFATEHVAAAESADE